MADSKRIELSAIDDYYSSKLKEHGASSKGVDWNGNESHRIRFEQLTKLMDNLNHGDQVLDFGCGYGAYLDYLEQLGHPVDYTGVDISSAMIESARTIHPKNKKRFQLPEDLGSKPFDYVVANGVFNVKLDQEESSWITYIEECLDELNERSRKGFAFNILTSYSDVDKRKPHLYYANPMYWFDRCKRRYSRNVSLLHDYDLYEFTVLVRKS